MIRVTDHGGRYFAFSALGVKRGLNAVRFGYQIDGKNVHKALSLGTRIHA